MEAFLDGAGDGWVGRGQCLDHYGAGEAYLPVLEAVGRLARGPGGDRVVAILLQHAPTWLAQMPRLVRGEAAAALQSRTAGATRERMFREMAEALEALAAERPLVLVLEDLHWSDPSTLDLVAGVARRREPARLLLLGTYRPLDAIVRGHPLRAVAQELALHGACEELALGPLDEASVGRYLAGRVGGQAGARLTRTVHRRSDGLPLFYAGHDTGVCAWAHLARGQWLLGYPDRALAALREAVGLAERLAHPVTTVIALHTAAEVYFCRGELAAARESARQAVALIAAGGFQRWLDQDVFLACVAIREGAGPGAVAGLLDRLSAARERLLVWRTVLCGCLLAEAAGEVGDVETGLDALARIPAEYQETFYAPEIPRIRGELLGMRGERAEAEACCRRAIELARRRAERSRELRAATGLARLLARERRPEDARAAVGGIYAWFTEGLDPPTSSRPAPCSSSSRAPTR